MFGLGMPEILLILAIALIVIGPKKLPELAKTLGRAMGEFKRSAQDFKRSIDIESTVRDIDPPPATDLRKVVKEANEKSDASKTDPPAEDNTSESSDPAGNGGAEDGKKQETPSDDTPQTPPSNA